MIAGISEIYGLVHFSIFPGSNKTNTFMAFIEGLKSKAHKPSLVIMDNLSVHHAKALKSLFKEGFSKMFLPKYSCTLNSIEKLWSIVKS